ncbi:hypothetical protein WMY93_030590, partial [Mugilogobius chulae]
MSFCEAAHQRSPFPLLIFQAACGSTISSNGRDLGRRSISIGAAKTRPKALEKRRERRRGRGRGGRDGERRDVDKRVESIREEEEERGRREKRDVCRG